MAKPSAFLRWAVLLALGLVSFAASVRAQEVPGMGGRRRFSIAGSVRDAQTSALLENVKLDLRATSGEIVSTVFTTTTGSFIFNNIGPGSYTIEILQSGYVQTSQQTSVNEGPVIGLDIELRHLVQVYAPGTQSGVVSARDLVIPRKAREAMDRGVQLLYEKSDYAGSVVQFQRALAIYAGYYEAYFQIGVAYIQMHDDTNAEQSLRKAVEIDSKYADAYKVLAMLLNNGQRFSEAEPAARKSVEIKPDGAGASFELARALYGLNRYEDAEPCLRQVIEKQPENGQAYLMLANVYVKLHNFPALLDDLNAYLKTNPSGAAADRARELRDKLQAMADQNVTPTTPDEARDAPDAVGSPNH